MPRRVLAVVVFAVFCLHAWADDVVHSRTIAPGVTFSSIRRDSGPWEIRVVRVARAQPLVRLDAAVGKVTVRGFAQVSRIVASTSRDEQVIAAVNGDFYAMSGPTAGLTRGPSIAGGELVSTGPGRDSVYSLADGTLGIGRLEVRADLQIGDRDVALSAVNRPHSDDGLALYTSRWGWPIPAPGILLRLEGLPLRSHGQWTGSVVGPLGEGASHEIAREEVVVAAGAQAGGQLPEVAAGQAVSISVATEGVSEPIVAAVGGGPVLVRDGRMMVDEPATAPAHPRTAVGYNDRELVLVTVDGRQPGWSVGMRLSTLAALMQEMGCTDAINLDGGGSTTAWVRGEVTNRPSDGRERSVANALLVLLAAPVGPPARIELEPAAIVAMSGARVPMRVSVLDQWYNPLPATIDGLEFGARPEGITAELVGETLLLAGPPAVGTLRVSHPQHPEARTELPVRIVGSVDRLSVEPREKVLARGDEVRLRALGSTDNGEPVWLAEGEVAWSVAGDGFASLGGGLFAALIPGSRALARAQVGPATGSAVLYTVEERMLEDFESEDPQVRASCWPNDGSVSGGAMVLPHGPEAAGSFCRLSFDLGAPQGTRAVYLVLDRELGRALQISLRARRQTDTAAWVRAQVVDGNQTTHRFTLSGASDLGEAWSDLHTRLPDGLKPPLTWQSVYVVATAGNTTAGHLDVDDLRASCLPD